MSICNVELTEQQQNFIDAGIAEGRFSDAGEAVRAGLQLLERQESEDKEKLEWLRGAVQDGVDALDRGDYVRLRSPAEIDTFVDEIRSEVMAGQSGPHARA